MPPARVVAPLVAALLVVAAACDDDDPDPTAPQEQPVLEVQTNTGDPVCMQVDEDFPPEVETLPIIGCEVPHTHEIYATLADDDSSVYPGVEQLGSFAAVKCLEAFEPFVGTSAFDSSLSYTWLVPTLASWNDDDDREILCVLSSRDGSSLVGSARSTGV